MNPVSRLAPRFRRILGAMGFALLPFLPLQAAPVLDKSADTTQPLIGGTFRYTLTYDNAGSPTAGAVLTDVVPPGLTVVGVSPGGVLAGSTLTWNLGNLACQDLTVTMSVQSDNGGNWGNTTQVVSLDGILASSFVDAANPLQGNLFRLGPPPGTSVSTAYSVALGFDWYAPGLWDRVVARFSNDDDPATFEGAITLTAGQGQGAPVAETWEIVPLAGPWDEPRLRNLAVRVDHEFSVMGAWAFLDRVRAVAAFQSCGAQAWYDVSVGAGFTDGQVVGNTASLTSTAPFSISSNTLSVTVRAATATPTPTATSSFTATPTATPTPTETPSPTTTLSPTETRTPTPSRSPTSTRTPTITPTPGVVLAKVAAVTAPRSGQEVPYVLRLNVTQAGALNIRVWDTLPALLRLESVPTPSAPGSSVTVVPLPTAGPTPGTGSLIVWTIPFLAPGVHDLGVTARVADLVPGGVVIVNEAARLHVGDPTPQTARAAVTVSGEVQVRIAVLNQAGERVRDLLSTTSSIPYDDLAVGPDDLLSSLDDRVEFSFHGVTVAAWDGRTADGTPVANGEYYVQVDNLSPEGIPTSLTREIRVYRVLSRVSVRVYNAAGEQVRLLAETVSDSGIRSGDVRLSNSVISPSFDGGNTNRSVQLTLADGTTLTWDGRDDRGMIVPNGQYFIEVATSDETGSEVALVRDITVRHPDLRLAEGGFKAVPNVAGWDTARVLFTATSTTRSFTLHVRIYNAAGELVKSIQGLPGTGEASWDFPGRKPASGLYLAVVEAKDATGAFERKVLRVLIIRS